MLYAKVVRAQCPRARIVKIDVSKARALAGVRAVISGKDFPATLYGPFLKDEPPLARDCVRYYGEPIVAVAALDEETAAKAVQSIAIEYEELPSVLDPEKALAQSTVLVHDAVEGYRVTDPCIRRYGNVCLHTRLHRGEVRQGFSKADYIFEDTFDIPMIHQMYLEPHVAVAEVDFSGKVTVWTSAQQPFVVRSVLGEIFDLPLGQIRIISPPVGGGFGGKEEVLLEPICVLLARLTNRPVKMALTLEEELVAGTPRPATKVFLRTGVTRDGYITARQARLVYDAGAYAKHAAGETCFGALTIAGPYRIPNIDVEGLCVYTNKVPSGCFRGYGCSQSTFASESQLDLVARRLGIDPLELRLRNAVEPGDCEVTGQPMLSVAFKETLQKAAEVTDWHHRERQRRANHGFGIACAYKGISAGASSAVVKLNEDGTATVLTGVSDIGTGTSTGLVAIAAESLGVDVRTVTLVASDTESTPYDLGSVASRVLHDAGNAVRLAGSDARRQLIALAAERLGANPDDLVIAGGLVSHRARPGVALSVSEIASLAHVRIGGPIVGRGSYLAEVGRTRNEANMENFPLSPMPTYGFATQIVEVIVDDATGQVRVSRAVSAHDAGRVVNPLLVQAQIEGGMVMGISLALAEELIVQDGRVANSNLADYKVLTAADTPRIEAFTVEGSDPSGPYDAKGMGELPVLPTAAAIANALDDAIGVRLRALPMTPERVWMGIRGTKGEGGTMQRNST
jgi:carbon-monoxide dehydrogenase large subunit